QNQTFLLEDVVRRFGMTDAGYQAMQELARVQQDRGDPGAAARTLELQSAHPNEKRPRDLLIAAASLLAESGLPDAARSLLDRHAELIAKDTRDNLDSQFQQLQAIVPPASEAQLFEWRVP